MAGVGAESAAYMELECEFQSTQELKLEPYYSFAGSPALLSSVDGL